jgi:DNA-binding XRE family transcriptional regulator
MVLALDTSENKKPLKHKEITEKIGVSRQTINI